MEQQIAAYGATLECPVGEVPNEVRHETEICFIIEFQIVFDLRHCGQIIGARTPK